MRSLLFASTLLIGACSPETQTVNGSSVDINEAAVDAQNDVDAYAEQAAADADGKRLPPVRATRYTLPADPAAEEPLVPPAPGQPGGLPDDRTPIAEAPFAADSAQGAADVVQTYYALIGERQYDRAWRLWDRGGQASGMSSDAFARGFAPFAEYHANVGAPGRIDAGAGQRYVTVPVQVYGRSKDTRRPFYLIGSVTLHRAGEVDGATAEQRSWRISDAALKPVAAPARAAPR